MANPVQFLTRTRSAYRMGWTDYFSYAYLVVGLFTMFAPVVWLVMSSLKTESALAQFPPTFLPYSQKSVSVPGYDQPLPLYLTRITGDDGKTSERPMAQVMRLSLIHISEPTRPY